MYDQVPYCTLSYVTDITVPYPTYPGTGVTVRTYVYRNFIALLVPKVPCCFGTAVATVLVFCNQAIHHFSKPKKNIRYSNYHGALWSCIPTKYKLVKKGKYGTVQ